MNRRERGGRTEIWERYIPHIFEHPIFGIGEAGFNTLGQDLNLVDSRGYGLSPHNVIIEVLLYTGFVGLSIMIAFWGKVAKRAFLIFKETKAILFDEEGRVLNIGRFNYPLYSPNPAVAEQDPDEIFQAVKQSIQQVIKLDGYDISTLQFISFSAAMHSVIAINKNGHPITKCITWADSRATKWAETIKKDLNGIFDPLDARLL